MRVLAVGAHPDDLELLCGGTLARYAAEGHEVTMCHVASGDRASYVHTMEEIAGIRQEEATAAAKVIEAEHISLGLSDGEIDSSDARQRDMAINLVRACRPDVILIHHPSDYNPDHVEAGKLIEDASFIASIPLYETTHPAHVVPPAVYYMDTLAGIDFSPVEYVDISEYIDVKLSALACHASQLSWLLEHDSVDILEQTRVVSAFRGYQAGTAFAEGFIPCAKWLRTRTTRLLP